MRIAGIRLCMSVLLFSSLLTGKEADMAYWQVAHSPTSSSR